MMNDRQCQCSNDQTVTVTAVSTDSYNLGAADLNIGAGHTIEAWAQVTAAMTAGGTSLKVAIVGDDAADLSSPIVLYDTEIVLAAVLVAGYKFKLGSVPATDLQYLGFVYTADGTFSGGGTLSAGFILDRPNPESV